MSDIRNRTRRPARSWTNDLVIVAAAAVCALITWAFAAPLGGVDLEVVTGDEQRTVDGVAVAVVSVLAALVGILALRILERSTDRALGVWTVIAVVVALVSLLGATAAASPAAMGTLMALHGVVAAVVIVGAVRSRRAVRG